MNIQSDSETPNGASQPRTMEGYHQLLSTSTIFEMDLVGKNLHMNGIDAVWFYHDPVENPDEISSLFVRNDQKENALSLLTSLDLTDFTTHNG